MPKTKELSITGADVRVKADANKTIATIESPDTDGVLRSIAWDDVVEFVRGEQVSPDEVFTDEQLEAWAKGKGFVQF